MNCAGLARFFKGAAGYSVHWYQLVPGAVFSLTFKHQFGEKIVFCATFHNFGLILNDVLFLAGIAMDFALG